MERKPKPNDTSRNPAEHLNVKPNSQLFLSLNLKLVKVSTNEWPKFPQSGCCNWGSILEQIWQAAGNETIPSSGESTMKTGVGENINPADEYAGGTRSVRRKKTM